MSGGGFQHTACAVCGHVLNQYTGSFGENWVHALEEDNDHPAVPVPSGSIRTIRRCDFCMEPDAAWVLPVETYSAGPEDQSLGDWQCCAECADFLKRDDWDGLTRRAMAGVRRSMPGEALRREVFELMYSQLREHITGPVRLAP